jgi:hypothetical protein
MKGKPKADLATRLRRVGLQRTADVKRFAGRHLKFARSVEGAIDKMEIHPDAADRLFARTMRLASVELAERASRRLR